VKLGPGSRIAHAAPRQRNGGDRPPQKQISGLFRQKLVDGRVSQNGRSKGQGAYLQGREGGRAGAPRSSNSLRRLTPGAAARAQNVIHQPPPIASFSAPPYGGWEALRLDRRFRRSAISWRIGGAGDFRETGFSNGSIRAPASGMPIHRSSWPADAPAATIKVAATSTPVARPRGGSRSGSSGKQASFSRPSARFPRNIGRADQGGWLSFREFNGLLGLLQPADVVFR